MKKFYLMLIAVSSLFANLYAQDENTQDKEFPVDLAVEFKNAHIWRGLDVTHNFLIDVDARLTDRSKTFALGIWGATTFSSDFREFDYYVGFYKAGFSLEVWDVLNFSDKNQYGENNLGGYNTKDAFDYNARTTGHFVDLRLGYTLPKQFPLHLGWNTVLYGRDRAWIPKDLTAPFDIDNRKVSNARYSTYVEADYPILKGNIVDVKLGVAAVFTFKDAKIDGQKIKGTFYGKHQGFSNVNLTVSKNIKISKNYTLPVSLMAVWNTDAKKTYIQVATQVIRF